MERDATAKGKADEPLAVYLCERCGAESCNAVDAARGYCAICGCYAAEFRGVRVPAAWLTRLLVA